VCFGEVFENKVLRRISGSKRDKVTGEWRRLHTEELYTLYLYYSGDHIKKNEMGWIRIRYGGEERYVQGFSREI
jgi:hypothetical protein